MIAGVGSSQPVVFSPICGTMLARVFSKAGTRKMGEVAWEIGKLTVMAIPPQIMGLTMTQPPPDEAELLELLELARIGEQKAKKLYETAMAIAEKYEGRAEAKLAAAQKPR